MNKKLLFAAMSLAMLTACTDNDFESQKVAQEVGAVQFEFVNNNDATRAAMMGTNNNKLVWSSEDKDILTLYHGAEVGAVTGYQNATYSIQEGEDGGTAKLTTPSMILEGGAIMVWPADTTFRIKSNSNLSVVIPTQQSDIANQIPYVSDQINIAAFDKKAKDNTATIYNEAGWNRTYPVYMRPMASQLNIKAEYAGTDDVLKELYDGDDPIDPISVESIDLLTKDGVDGHTKFSTELAIAFANANPAWADLPNTMHQAWAKVTTVNRNEPIATAAKLTTTFLNGNDGGKFIILPQPVIGADGVEEAAVVVNTIYGKVVVGTEAVGGKYEAGEITNAWWRFVLPATAINYDTDHETKADDPEASGDNAGKYKVTADIAHGMKQTFNWFGVYAAPEAQVLGEYEGVKTTRYVKVLLTHLDMSDLHIKSDKQLRDVARVWKQMGLDGVTVYLDDDLNADKSEDADDDFHISQNTIAVINNINTGKAFDDMFKVQPCKVAVAEGEANEAINKIVITGGNNVPDLAFIVKNGDHKADVVLNAGENWSWSENTVAGKKAVTVATAAQTGINSIINEGTFASNASATIAIYDNTNPNPAQISTIPFINDGTWNVTATGDLTVQFDVTNYGIVNIKKGAEYHQDIIGENSTTFTNEALTLPGRFLANPDNEEIGKVYNAGVFAVTGTTAKKGIINNYGLIEHGVYPGDAYNKDAKTYITANQMGVGGEDPNANPTFANAFDAETVLNAAINKLGRINLPYSNRLEDNISISAALAQGFVSVTVASNDAPETDELSLTVVGDKVNYVIIRGGITSVTEMTNKIKYIEFDDVNDTEIAWQTGIAGEPKEAIYDGLIVLSPINIKLYTTVTVNKATYLGAKMYVGGEFNNGASLWNGYYGNTTANEPTMYITYGN